MRACCLNITNAERSQDTYKAPAVGHPVSSSVQTQSVFREEFTPELGRHGSVVAAQLGFDPSFATSTTKVSTTASVGPSKAGTLGKQPSLTNRHSMIRKGSKRSLRAGITKGMAGVSDEEFNNVFRVPIPTNANPTEALANRFQGP